MPVESDDPALEPAAADRFLARLARMLHEAGTPAHRLEGLLQNCADRLGVRLSVFSLPTWINISIGEEGAQRVISFRVDPGSPKLAMLEETFLVADRVARGEYDAEQGNTALARVQGRLSRPTVPMNCLGYALFSAGAAFFLGGSWLEMLAAVPIGFVVGGTIALAAGRRERELLAEFASAAIATVVAGLVVLLLRRSGFDPTASVVALAGLVTLLPGLSLATAMSELSTRNLASGSARLIGAITTLVVVGMGAGIGDRMADALGLPQHSSVVVPVTQTAGVSLALLVALVAIASGLAIVFQARPRRAIVVLISCIAGWVAVRAAREIGGSELAPVIAAAAVGMLGNLYARFRRRPTLAIVLPGLALLLPGSLGFRGMQGLITSDTIAGLNTAISALVVAASIAAGLLVANALLPSPRHV
ncbi:MAG: hypothetical protein RLZZ116_1755 [Planctomycetota bacterium]|jgi:uncharacterized membrane protein YjjP (DUF1212 family)